MASKPIRWTAAEQQAVRDAGVKIARAGDVGTIMKMFEKAQHVLPKARRRAISTLAKVPWFSEAVKMAQHQAANLPADTPSQADPAGSRRLVRWTQVEKSQLCDEAARLISSLEAGGPHQALLRAQANILPPERRRTGVFPSMVADWYPAELQAAMQRHKAKEVVVPPPTPTCDVPVVSSEVVETVQHQQEQSSFVSMFGGSWAALRERVVQEIASIVVEGIQRGLGSVKLSAPPAEEPVKVTPVPFALEPRKGRPPSVLVVGLRGGQAPQIKAEFGSKLDLRFCSSDNSKDQLRAMTEQADTTIAFVDFLSHSHTDIIKARSKHYIESAGGMTSLRQHLSKLTGGQVNAYAQAA